MASNMASNMASKLFALGGAAMFALLVSLTASAPADARGYHGGHFGGHFGFGHHGFHRRVFIGGPLVYGAYAYDYDDYGESCYWLRRRAVVTGNPYWWRRYEACVADY